MMNVSLHFIHTSRYHKGVLPITSFDPVTHVLVAWAVGTLMAFLAETYRRQMFANHKLAADAAARELLEAQARIRAQQASPRIIFLVILLKPRALWTPDDMFVHDQPGTHLDKVCLGNHRL